MRKAITDATGRVVSRTSGTETQYLRFGERLMAEASVVCGSRRLPDAISWFAQEVGHGRWSRSTIRSYKAAMRLQIDLEVESGAIPMEIGDDLNAILKKPVPKLRIPRRTSGKKRRSIPQSQWEHLLHALGEGAHPDDDLARRAVFWGPTLGMRPCEYCTAHIDQYRIQIRNGKATNGRANGEVRVLVHKFDAKQVLEIQSLFSELAQRATTSGSPIHAWRAVARRLTRTCERIKIKPIAPYTLRHIAIATDKKSASPKVVAARHGHKSTRTAGAFYAPRSTGWIAPPIEKPTPTPETIAKVIESNQVSREINMASRRKSDVAPSAPSLDPIPVRRSTARAYVIKRERASPEIFHKIGQVIVNTAVRMARVKSDRPDWKSDGPVPEDGALKAESVGRDR